MGKAKISELDIQKIIRLRKLGYSIVEIRKVVPIGKTTIFRYIKDLKLSKKSIDKIRSVQGGSKRRSEAQWNIAKNKAKNLIGNITNSHSMLILASLYWGEGNKKELNLINSDSKLILTFIQCLRMLGVKNREFKISLRLYEDINKEKATNYWAKNLNFKNSDIKSINVIKGKKAGKLEYGMCRVRVEKGQQYFKLIMSMIDLIKSNFLPL
jgi:DNA-binding transcriptional MerR regulator